MKDAVDVLNERIAELEAIVVQQRDGFFEQDKRIAELEHAGHATLLREVEKDKRIAELENDCSIMAAGMCIYPESLDATSDHDTILCAADKLERLYRDQQAENEELKQALEAAKRLGLCTCKGVNNEQT